MPRRSPSGAFLLLDLPAVCPCFTPGTLVTTDRGQRPIETLKRGDRVVTRDNGLKRIYWIGRRDLALDDLRGAPHLAPVLVRAGALGGGKPLHDMLVSPNHRFLIRSVGSAGSDERLAQTRSLVDGIRVRPAATLGVSYIHLLCDRHQVILANGAWTESFHPDDDVVRGLGRAHRKEILEIFPEIETIGASVRFPSARPLLEPRSRFER